MDLNGKNVVYIGGCGGIGSATCKLLVKKRIANLAVLDIAENPTLIKELSALSPSTKVFYLKIDICNRDDIVKCFNEVYSKIKRIDILVNGSAMCNEFQAEIPIAVNLLGLINCSMIALDIMGKSKNQQRSLIVNIASYAGIDPFPFAPIYSATKAGVLSYTRCMADEINFSRHGVQFIAICPSYTATSFVNQFTDIKNNPNSEGTTKDFNEVSVQTPDDCAKNIIKAIEISKNGASYFLDAGQMSEVNFPNFLEQNQNKLD